MLSNQEAERAFNAISTWARTDYPNPYYREEVMQTAFVLLCHGFDIDIAYSDAQRLIYNQERRPDKEISYNALEEQYGDALRCQPMLTPSVKPDTTRKAVRRAGRNATPRQPERGIEELGLEDETVFPTVLRNDYQRGILPEVGELALDIELQPKRKAGLLRLILSSAGREELRERGYKTSEIKGAIHWLTQYYATPPSR